MMRVRRNLRLHLGGTRGFSFPIHCESLDLHHRGGGAREVQGGRAVYLRVFLPDVPDHGARQRILLLLLSLLLR